MLNTSRRWCAGNRWPSHIGRQSRPIASRGISLVEANADLTNPTQTALAPTVLPFAAIRPHPRLTCAKYQNNDFID